ncbi:MAG: hypothetical protein JJU21_13055 [Salinarimonas sp.]|nr:hypothetical protein [Salinarimonas sp.]
MSVMPFVSICHRTTRNLRRAAMLLVAVPAFGGFGAAAQADTTRITVTTGPQVAQQSKIVHSGADQTIRIVIADPVRPGIRRAPVAEPVIYVIEADDAVRAVR